MAKVLFYSITAAQYAAIKTKDSNALYFLTDTGEIFKGTVRFSFPVKAVTAFPTSGEAGVLYINTTNYEAKLWGGTAWTDAVLPVTTDVQHTVTDSQIPTAKAVRDLVEDNAEHLAFAVFPTDFDIPAGAVADMAQTVKDKLAAVYGDWVLTQTLAVAIPAQMTHLFNFATVCRDLTKCDVVVDWGDGTRSVVAAGEYHKEMTPSTTYGHRNVVMKHTYATSGRFVVKIYGHDYYALRQAVSTEESGDPALHGPTCNLVCDCLSRDLPIPSFLKNGSSMFCYTDRLLKVEAGYCYPLRHVTNAASMFFECRNLISVRNLSVRDSVATCFVNMFAHCYNLQECTVSFPALLDPENGLYEVFSECSKLATNIADFFPGPFLTRNLSVLSTFSNCPELTGTVPAQYLWGDSGITWELNISNDASGSNQNGMFYGCSDAIRAQVPKSWGGTSTTITPAAPIADEITELKQSTTWGELE